MGRRAIYIDGFAHGAQPIPAASRKGPLVVTGGVHGIDRATGALADGLEAQTEAMFDNLSAILVAAGGSMDDLVKLTVKVRSNEARMAVNRVWEVHFPDAATRPARHTLLVDALPGAMLVQCEGMAFVED
ncbi:MAG: RidA family protein [Sphingopyxis macrogoltabida]|uniref:RidA family protein n=1 Tax=Sphingopyxis macrogoltabida TaxID=33050 RepID=A0A2W5KZC5_SPHMC|nr:MAG: RidA family protein [Sphingopyxis macrogoltabida]